MTGHLKTCTKKTKSSKPKLLVADIRNREDFIQGHVSSSINIPSALHSLQKGSLLRALILLCPRASKGRSLSLWDMWEKYTGEFAAHLVKIK